MSASGKSKSIGNYCLDLKDSSIKYETGRGVEFEATVVALFFRLIQVLILAYIGGYVVYFEKGYQEFELGISSVVAKVKGIQKSNLGYTWDEGDYIVPPLENNALFVTTAVVFTPKQHTGICPEIDIPEARCFYDYHCPVDQPVKKGNGFMTGTCNTITTTCLVSAWCPLEKASEGNSTLHMTLTGGENATILVKNFILFPKNKIKRRNIGDDLTTEYLGTCVYNQQTDPFCPIFVLGDIISLAGEDYDNLTRHGGVISFGIDWKCDLDFNLGHCLPKYSFRRLDGDHEDFPGWNFRHAGYWDENDMPQRALIKSTGIRIVFNVDAIAGKFSAIKTTLVLGSSLGLLGLANMFCDYILLNWTTPAIRIRRTKSTTLEAEKVEEVVFQRDRAKSFYKPAR